MVVLLVSGAVGAGPAVLLAVLVLVVAFTSQTFTSCCCHVRLSVRVTGITPCDNLSGLAQMSGLGVTICQV